MPVIDLSSIVPDTGTTYPGQFARLVDGRSALALGDAGGLTQFGVNLVRLDPGAMSSLRHYQTEQDEFVMITEGVCTLIDDAGAHELRPGDCAAFPAGDPNGHHLQNRTSAPSAFLVVGTRTKTETVYYSDVDMRVKVEDDQNTYTRKDGSPLTADQIGD